MNKFLPIFLTIAASLFSFYGNKARAQSYDFSWVSDIASSSNVLVRDVKVSGSYAYVGGYFAGTADFDPGAGTTTLTSAGSYDGFFAKYDKNTGALIWAQAVGGTGADYIMALEVNGSYVYIGGYFSGTADFNPSPSTTYNFTALGGSDGFFGKYYVSSGGLVWAKQLGGTSYTYVRGLAVDATSKVYVVGNFSGTVDFDPSGTAFNLTSGGSYDGFIGIYTSAGAKENAWRSGDASYQEVTDIEVQGSYFYISGFYAGTCFGLPTSLGSYDGFIAKYYYTGSLTWQWAKSIGGTSDDRIYDIDLDASYNVFATGYHQGTADFDPSASTVNITSSGLYDGFVLKLASTGAYSWVKGISGTSNIYGRKVDVSTAGDVYVTGDFSGTAVFGSTLACFGFPPNCITLYSSRTSVGGSDVFVSKYSNTGTLSSYFSFGGTSSDYAYSLASDGDDFYSSGYFQGIVDFDVSSGVSELTSNGGYDGFITRYTALASEPTAQPSALTFSSVTSSSMTIGYTAAAGPPAGYIVLGKAGSAPTALPEDGQSYNTGNVLGDATVIYQGPGTSYNKTELNPATNYYISVFAYNGSGLTTNYRTSSPLSGSKYTLDTEPALAPTGLTFSDLTNSSFKGSFTGVAGASGYLVIRRAGAAPTGLPTDATTYSVNDAIGNGTVVHNGASTTFNQNSLAASTHYYYVVIAYNGSGATINYRTATVLSGSQNTLTTEPIAQPANLNFSGITTNSIGTVSFNGASGAPAGYIALRKAGSAPTAEPVDGTAYLLGDVIGDATVQHLGSALTFAESSLSPGTQYFYKIYSYNGANEFTNYYHPSPLQNSVFTLSAEPTAQPTSLAFTNVLQTTMDVGFTAATPAPGGGYIVLRKAGSSPSADPVDGTVYVATDVIGDATVAYVGTGTTFAESGLSAGTTYYYEVFSFSGSSATVNYLQTSPLSGNKLTAGVVTTPNFQPTGLSFASITNTSYTVTFAEASESPTGYIALRKSGSSPTGVPTDLTTYTVGQTIGDGTVAFVGSTTSFAESGLSSSTSYYYDIFSVNGTGGSEKYRTTTPLEGNVTTYAAEPLAQPTALLFSSVTTTSLTLSYTASAATGYLVIRKSGSAPTSLPSDGVAYSPGDLLGDATVVYAGPLTSINEPTLTSGTDYHYQVFAYNGSANTTNYLTATPLQGNQFLLSIEPTAQPTNLVFSNITTSSFDVTFTLAAGPPDGYIAIGALNTAPTAVPVDGVSYTPGDNIGDGVVAFDVVVGSASISGVLPATEAFLKIYAYKGVGAGRNYLLTSPLTGSVITLAEEPTEQPVFAPFTEVGTTTLRGHLDHPVSVPAGYLIVRKAASAPTGLPEDTVNYSIGDIIGDGIVVSVGSDTTFVDSLLTDNTTYHYRAFSFNGSGKAINYLTTTPAAGSATTLLVPTPTKQAQNLVFSNITGNSITIDFTVQLPAPDGFIVLRKAGSAPASLPVNGVAYAAGDTLGDAVVAYVDLATSGQITVDDIGLLSDTTFYYAIYAYNGDLTATKYLTTSPLTGSQHLLAAEPISQPSGLQFETVTNNSISARFTGSGAERYLVLRKAGSGPSQVPQDSVTYTAPGLLGTDNIIYIGPDTTFTDTGLSAVTQYYYAVFALNGTGVATNYANEAPMRRDTTTLSVEPTAQPTALTFSALSSTGFTVSFTGSGADGYLVLRREGAAVSVNPSDASPLTLGETNGVETVAYVGAGTSFDETGLKVNTAYHYAVFAYNGTGSTTNYLLTSPLIGFESTLPTDNSAPVMTQNNTVASISAGTAVEVSVALNDFETGINQAVVEYRAAEAGGTTWNSGVLVDDGTGTFKFTVPSSSLGDLGLEYRILATNKALMTATFGIYGVTIEKTNGTIVYNSSGVEVGNYRIISVPMELNVKAVKDVFVDLGPYDPKLWRLYHFGNGSLKEISTGGNIEVGSGYWFISKNDVNINTGPGVTVAVDSDSPFQLNLTAGWNQIGNPFPFTINWEKIKTENGFTGEVSGLTKFNGSFVPGSSLSAFEGGFVFAENAITILITPDKTKIGGKIEDEVHKVNNSIDSDYWELELNLEAGEILNRLAGLGMHNKATDEKDGFDYLNLPRFMDYLELNHVKDFMGYSYSKDVVKTKPEHTWEFSLETNVDTDHITLSWDNSYFGNNDKHLFLWDLSANKTIDMRQETTYTFSKSSTGKFKVLYGALDYVQSNLVPDEPVVLNTYPNPFHDEVTIQFALPKSLADHEVTIDIYSSLGVRVGTIFTGRLKPGMHEIRWNGMSDFNTKMAEGMYLIRINTGYQTGFKRIIYR